jgi:hypothetical protein
MVYWYLSQKRSLKIEDVPESPVVFLDALKTIFGQGAGILERTIVRELKHEFNITLGENLVEVLSLVKHKVSSSGTSNQVHSSSSRLGLKD